MRRPFSQGDLVTLTPTRLGKRGEADAEHEGFRVRVQHGIPGEAAEVRILHVSRGGPVASARFEAPSGRAHRERRRPPCPIHLKCGGCGLQHVRDDFAVELKVAQARATLGGAAAWAPPILGPTPFEYRAKTFLLPQRRGETLFFGARPPRGNRFVDTSGCAVLRPELEALAARTRQAYAHRVDLEERLRAVLLRCTRAGRTQVTLVHRGDPRGLVEKTGATATYLQPHDAPGNRIHSDEPERMVDGHGPLVERFAGLIDAVVPPTAFCQGNPDVAEQLYIRAADALVGERIAELYCGAGVAGLIALRRRGEATLTGVDRAPRAIAAARTNAERNGLAARARFIQARAEEVDADWDSVLVNPPRAGCDPSVLATIAASSAHRLVYLSCNADTLARDVETLGWRLISVEPADMFPQTPHLELLAILDR